MGFIIVIHVIACVSLIVIVLIQRGKGGGLLESFSGLETMFGTKTSAFLTKTTTIFSVIFFITCLLLTFLSVKRSKSLMEGIKTQGQQQQKKEDKTAVPAVSQPPEQAKSTDKTVVNNEQPKAQTAAQETKGPQKAP